MKKFHEAICAEGMAKKMKKQKKSSAGMSLGVVIIFITLMSVMVVAMMIAASTALRNARVLPEIDGHFYSAEAAMNRALPRIVADLLTTDPGFMSGTEASIANRIRAEAMRLIGAHDDFDSDTQYYEVREFLEENNALLLYASARMTEFINHSSNPIVMPGRLAGTAAPTELGATPVTGAGSEHFFHTLNNTALDEAAAGFAAPAYVNFLRSGDGNLIVAISASVTSVDDSGTEPFDIIISPVITVISETETATIHERIFLPVSTFRLYLNPAQPANAAGFGGLGGGPPVADPNTGQHVAMLRYPPFHVPGDWLPGSTAAR